MSFKRALLLVVIAEAVIIPLALFNYSDTIEILQAIARFSGRLSLLLFSIIFLSQKERGINAKSLLSENYFLIFAIAHGIHLIELLMYIYVSGKELNYIRVSGGFLAYLFIFIMPWLNEQFKNGKLSLPAFGRIEWFYLFYVWLIFFLTYLPRVLGKLPNAGGTHQEHVIFLSWLCVMLVVKTWSILIKKLSVNRN